MYLRAVPFNMGLSNFGICTLEWKLGWGKDGNCVHFLHCFRVLTGVWFSPVCPRSAGIKCCWATDSFSAFHFYTWMETWSWNENNRVWRTGKSLRLFPWMDLHEPVDSIIWLYIFNRVQIFLRTLITRLAAPLTFWTSVSSASLTPVHDKWPHLTHCSLTPLSVSCQPGKIFIYLVARKTSSFWQEMGMIGLVCRECRRTR